MLLTMPKEGTDPESEGQGGGGGLDRRCALVLPSISLHVRGAEDLEEDLEDDLHAEGCCNLAAQWSAAERNCDSEHTDAGHHEGATEDAVAVALTLEASVQSFRILILLARARLVSCVGIHLCLEEFRFQLLAAAAASGVLPCSSSS